MKLSIYSIYDNTANSFSPPFCSVNDNDAKRQFFMSAKSIPLMISYPDDFDLHCIGEFDTDTAQLFPAPDYATRIQKGARDGREATHSPVDPS